MGYVIDRYRLNLYCRCLGCANYRICRVPHSCKAYPKENGIPPKVWNGENAQCEYFKEKPASQK